METPTTLDEVLPWLIGVAVTTILAIGGAAWKVCSFIGKKLFDDEKGYATRITDAHIKFLDKLAEHDEQLSVAITELISGTKKIDGDLTTGIAQSIARDRTTHEGIAHLAELVHTTANIQDPAVKQQATALLLRLKTLLKESEK